MNRYIEVVTTTAERADAERLAREALARRFAACAQIDGPITSVYHWQGEIETATEWRCTFKTRDALHDALERLLLELHPYETPEIIVIDVVAGAQSYLDWIDASTSFAAIATES